MGILYDIYVKHINVEEFYKKRIQYYKESSEG